MTEADVPAHHSEGRPMRGDVVGIESVGKKLIELVCVFVV